MRRREFITLLGGAATAGRSPPGRNNQRCPSSGSSEDLAIDLCGEYCCHSSRTEVEAGYVEGGTSRLNIAGRRVNTIGCPRWRPIW